MKKINYKNLCCYNKVETQIEYFDPEVLLYSLAIIYTNGQFQYLEEDYRESTLFLIENEVNCYHYIFDNALGVIPPHRIAPADLHEAIVRAVIAYDGTAGALHREDLQQIIEAFMTAFYIADGEGLIDLPAPPLITTSHLPFGEDRLSDFGDHHFLHRVEQHIPVGERVFGAMTTHRKLHIYTESADSVFEYVLTHQELRSEGTLTVEEAPECSCVNDERLWNEDPYAEFEDLHDK